MIELLEAGQPVYDISVEGEGYEEGKKLAQERYNLIQYQMEHGVFEPHLLRQFMQGLVDGGPTKSGHGPRRSSSRCRCSDWTNRPSTTTGLSNRSSAPAFTD